MSVSTVTVNTQSILFVCDEFTRVIGDEESLSEAENLFMYEIIRINLDDINNIYVIDTGDFKDFIIILNDINYEKEKKLIGQYYDFFDKNNIEPIKFILLSQKELTAEPDNIIYHLRKK
ncbi:MAG: hypothetical protein FWG44_02060 [Oscillospiraceae bacterium]|nr:hypothetical protein [Oscillospiraceae bacterium]